MAFTQGGRGLTRMGIAAAFIAATMGIAHAQYVSPASYAATPGQGTAQGGVYNYFDDTSSQLTDGVLGVNDWTADLGNGPAYEWVAWRTVEPTVTFTFPAPVTITQVDIDFNRTEANAGIYLPPSVTVAGQNFALTGTEIPDFSRGWVSFPLTTPLTGTSLTLSLTDNDDFRWIFVDEVRFAGATVTEVPEPGVGVTALILAGGLALGVVRARRTGKAQN